MDDTLHDFICMAMKNLNSVNQKESQLKILCYYSDLNLKN